MSWSGRLLHIHIAERASLAMEELDEAKLIAGRGIEGDRYFNGIGTYSPKPDVREVTLIEMEVLDAIARARRATPERSGAARGRWVANSRSSQRPALHARPRERGHRTLFAAVDAGAWRDLSAPHAQVIARSVRRKPPSLASPVGTGLREEPNHVPKERHDACRHRRNRRSGRPCSSHCVGARRRRTRRWWTRRWWTRRWWTRWQWTRRWRTRRWYGR